VNNFEMKVYSIGTTTLSNYFHFIFYYPCLVSWYDK